MYIYIYIYMFVFGEGWRQRTISWPYNTSGDPPVCRTQLQAPLRTKYNPLCTKYNPLCTECSPYNSLCTKYIPVYQIQHHHRQPPVYQIQPPMHQISPHVYHRQPPVYQPWAPMYQMQPPVHQTQPPVYQIQTCVPNPLGFVFQISWKSAFLKILRQTACPGLPESALWFVFQNAIILWRSQATWWYAYNMRTC